MIMLPIRVGRAIASEPFESAQRELDTVLSRLLTGRGFFNGGDSAPYAVEVREDADHIYVEADLPVDERSVDAKLRDGVSTVTLIKREETKPRKISVA
jgi:HSP20 family molecular chaperone IbpA